MTTDLSVLVVSMATAAAAGLVGCFVVMRRMALAADALSHVALPGIAGALALGIHPLFGAVVMLLFGASLVWGLERRTHLATETIVGVVFSAALALGSLMSSGEELTDALFGGSSSLTAFDTVFGLVAAAAVVFFVLKQKSRLVLMLVSPEIARTAGIEVARLDFLFLHLFALTIALGLRYLGVLLMGSLVIIPAAAAKRLTRTLTGMLFAATGIAMFATVGGILIGDAVQRPTGPVIICIAALAFVLSLVRRPP